MLFHIKKGDRRPQSLSIHAWLSLWNRQPSQRGSQSAGCLFWLMQYRHWHTKPLFSIMLLWVPTRSASLPVCRLALSTLARLSTWGTGFPLSSSLASSPVVPLPVSANQVTQYSELSDAMRCLHQWGWMLFSTDWLPWEPAIWRGGVTMRAAVTMATAFPKLASRMYS